MNIKKRAIPRLDSNINRLVRLRGMGIFQRMPALLEQLKFNMQPGEFSEGIPIAGEMYEQPIRLAEMGGESLKHAASFGRNNDSRFGYHPAFANTRNPEAAPETGTER